MNTIKLSEQDHKTIEESVKKIAEENKIESVEEVSIKLSKESGIVFFKEAILEKKPERINKEKPDIAELAESFISGNISTVREEIDGDTQLKHNIYDYLKEMGMDEEASSFRKLIFS
jgi:hypothetical protein